MKRIYVGTSGFDYPEWKNIFYPQNLSRSDFLSYYSSHLNALEINSTFYSMPNKNQVARFLETSGGRINFSVKANRVFTHQINSLWKNYADDFIESLEPFAARGKINSIIFQFPGSFGYTAENRKYLWNLLKRFENFSAAVEFRSSEWIRDSVFEGLNELNAAAAICAIPQKTEMEKLKSVLGRNFYFRLHPDYSLADAEDFALMLGNMDVDTVQVYFSRTPWGIMCAEHLYKIMFP